MSMKLDFSNEKVEEPHFTDRDNLAYQALENNHLNDIPYIQAQESLERLFDKNQQTKRLREVYDIEDLTIHYNKSNLSDFISKEFCIDLCVQMALYKRARPSTLIGILYHHFDINEDRAVAMQKCANALEECVHANFIDYSVTRDEFIIRANVPNEVQRDIDRFQYPLPCIVNPKRITKNTENGYHNEKTKNSLVVLKAGKEYDTYKYSDLCLDHLNKMNAIPLTINQDVVALINNSWGNLDTQKRDESTEDFNKRVKAFQKYDRDSKDVIAALTQLRDKFWLTHKYDRRGRVYCQGYHINYQGNPWNKAVVEFANKELLNE